MVTRAESAAEGAAAAGERALAIVERARVMAPGTSALIRMSAVAAAAVAHADAAQDASDAAQVLAPSAGPDQSLKLARLANKFGLLDPGSTGDLDEDRQADGGADGAAHERQCGAARFLCRSRGAPQAPDAAAAAHASLSERLAETVDHMLHCARIKAHHFQGGHAIAGVELSRGVFNAAATSPPLRELDVGELAATPGIPLSHWTASLSRPGLAPSAPVMDGDFEPPPSAVCLDPMRGDMLSMMRAVQRAALLCGLRQEEDCPLPDFVLGIGDGGA